MQGGSSCRITNQLLVVDELRCPRLEQKLRVMSERSVIISGNVATEVPAHEQTQLDFGSPRRVEGHGTGDLFASNEPIGVTEDHQASDCWKSIVGLIVPRDLSTMSRGWKRRLLGAYCVERMQ